MKSSEVSIKTRSTLASLSSNGQATKHTTVKWSIPAYGVYDQILNLNISKSTIGTPVKCVKLA